MFQTGGSSIVCFNSLLYNSVLIVYSHCLDPSDVSYRWKFRCCRQEYASSTWGVASWRGNRLVIPGGYKGICGLHFNTRYKNTPFLILGC